MEKYKKIQDEKLRGSSDLIDFPLVYLVEGLKKENM